MQRNYIALSFDIEDWYHSGPISGASISKYNTLEEFLNSHEEEIVDCISEETDRILQILNSFDIKATFFVVADVVHRYNKITEKLKKSPHEIASHSSTHQSAINDKTKKPLLSVQAWKEDQLRARRDLENIFEREIIGFRAPNAYFANWMVKPLSEIGIKYDSSIAYNSFYNKTNVKLKDIPLAPYRLNSVTLGTDNPDSELVELPWSYFRLWKNLIFPAGGAYFFRLLGYRYFKYTLHKALREGDTMFYLHPNDISSKKIPEVNNKNFPAYWINKGKRAEERLIKLLKTFKDQIKPCNYIFERYIGENKL